MSQRDQFHPYSPYAVAPSTAPRIGEWLSEAFTLFGREWQTWLGQGFIFTLLVYGPMLLGYFAFYGIVIAAGVSSSPGPSSQPPSWFITAMMTSVVAMVLGILVGGLLSVYLSAGMKLTAAKQLRGEPIRVADIWSGGPVFLPLLGVYVLTYLAMIAGAFLLCIGAYLAAALLFFAAPLAVEERMSPMDAIRRSWEAVRPHMWMYLLWIFLLGMIAGVGAQFCLVGAAATLPIYFIAMMISYRDAIGLPGALPPAVSRPQASPQQVPTYASTEYGPGGAPVAGPPCPNCSRPLAVGAVICPHCRVNIPYGYTANPAGIPSPAPGPSQPES